MMLAIARDIFSLKRLFYFLCSLVLVSVIRFADGPMMGAFPVQIFSVFLLTYLSSVQLYQSYFTRERLLGYGQLPLSLSAFQLAFVLVTLVFNSMERLSLLLFFFDYAKQTAVGIAYVFLSSFFVILVSFLGFCWLQETPYSMFKRGIVLLSGVASLGFLLLQNIFLVGCGCILLLYCIYRSADFLLILDTAPAMTVHFAWGENYFLSQLLKNHSFWYNSVFLFIFAGILLTSDFPTSMKGPLLLSLASLNTPLTTLISVDQDLQMQLQMLPKPTPLYWMYAQVLSVYYSLVNGIMGLVLIIQGQQPVAILIKIALLTVIELSGILLLERYFPISNHQLACDVWKHPRKYLLPTLIFLFLVLFS